VLAVIFAFDFDRRAARNLLRDLVERSAVVARR